MIALAAILLIGFTPSDAAAFGYQTGVQQSIPTNPNPAGVIKWCVRKNVWTSNLVPAAMTSAAEHWDSKMDRYSIEETSGYPTNATCNIRVYIDSWSANGRGTGIGRGGPVIVNGQWAYSEIYINSDHVNRFWFYTANQNCTVGVNCAKDIDFFSAFAHEFGHALNLSHNKNYSSDPCVNGFFFTDTAGACIDDFYSTDIMFFLAADGYRRWITEDSLRGLRALGYRW